MSNKHSKLAPSSAARRMACPGSREMSDIYGKNEETEASKEGTLAHELAAIYAWKPYTPNWEAPKGYTIEMHEGAELYSSTIQKYISNDCRLCIEDKVEMSDIHQDMWGTPDAYILTLDNKLHVFDYKFGYTPVDAYENWQLLAYACGILTGRYSVTDIYLHIIQPRDYISGSKHKIWHLTIDELNVYKHRLIVSESLAMTMNAPLRVSAECKYCPARHACPALRDAAFGAAETSYRVPMSNVSVEHIGSELKLLQDAREILDYRISALETEVEHYIRSGINVDNFEMKQTESRLNWKSDKKEVLELGLLLGIDLRKEDIVTPTQAIKLGLPEEEVKKHSERKASMKLCRTDVTKAKAVFNKQ